MKEIKIEKACEELKLFHVAIWNADHIRDCIIAKNRLEKEFPGAISSCQFFINEKIKEIKERKKKRVK